MSKIKKLGSQLENAVMVAAEYAADLDEVNERLTVKGKSLEQALKEQTAWPSFYDERRVELRTIVKFIELREAKLYGQRAQHYKEVHSRDLTDKMIEHYIKREDEYQKLHELYLEVEEVYELYCGVVESFKRRSFALRDLTLARVHQVESGLM